MNSSQWTEWRKSSHSAENGQCVEVFRSLCAGRDSKNPDGPMLRVDLAALVAELRADGAQWAHGY